MSNPRVCMIAYTDYAFDGRVRREGETLASSGFDVVCLTTKNGPKQRVYRLNGVEVRELKVDKYRGKSYSAYLLSYLHFLCAASFVCARLLARNELDVVHAHNLPDFLTFAGLLPRLAGRKVVLDVHDSVPETFAAKFAHRPILRQALCLEEKVSARVAHGVICVNETQRDTLVARGIPASKTFISMNVPDPAIFHQNGAGPAARNPDNRIFNLVYHGTMAERLGVDLIIRAVESLRQRIPGIRLHLWGRGDDLSTFRALSTRLGLDDCVDFNGTGFDLAELPALLRPMDVGVVGNRQSEATALMLPVKLMEYISLGIPAVVPRLRTIEHYFSPDMVAFYEPENVASLAEALYRLYSNPELRGHQAEQAIDFLRTHGWQRQGPELVAWYRQLVAPRMAGASPR